MASTKKKFLLILSLSLILCQESNKTEQQKEIPKTETIKDANSTAHDTNDTQYKKQQQKRDFKSKIPFNMTIDEMDKMMMCTVVVQETMKKIRTNIEEIQRRINITSVNPIYEKVGTDLFESCNNKIDIKLVNNYMKNLTYLNNFKWGKEFDELAKIDFDKYNNETDLRLTMNQQILMYKYQRVDELFRQKRADERDKIDKENQKIKIGEIDMESIPTSVKFLIFLVILVLLFGGVFYLLKTLEKKPKDKKKKEKKKKTQ